MAPEEMVGGLSETERACSAGLVGAHLRNVYNEAEPLQRRAAQRARLLAALEAPAPSWYERVLATLGAAPLAWSAALGVLLVAGGVLFSALRPDVDGAALATLTASLQERPVATGQWLRTVDAPKELVFSDGTRMTLATSSQLRVGALSVRGAVVALEEGHLDADVVPHTGYEWVFQAGHYTVTVLGTVLSLDWDPGRETLLVQVMRGKVRVEDDRLNEAGSVVSAGGRLELGRVSEGSLKPDSGVLVKEPVGDAPADDAARGGRAPVGPVGRALAESRGAGAAVPKPSSVVARPRRPSAASAKGAAAASTKGGSAGVATSRPVAAKQVAPSAVPRGHSDSESAANEAGSRAMRPDANSASSARWERFAEDGLYPEALRAAETDGVLAATSGLSPAKLWRLADAARLAGDHGQARRVLLDLRERYPTHRYAHSAAYNLGRMAFDLRDFREALSWFKRYLAGGRGDMDEPARARVFLALHELGERGEGGKAAAEYLRRYPNGANAARARALSSR